MRWTSVELQGGSERALLVVGIGALADFAAAFVLSAVLALAFGTAFRLLLFMTGVLFFLIGLPLGALPEGAMYRNPPYQTPSAHARPTFRDEERDRVLARSRRPLGAESFGGLALMILALVMGVLPPL